jgi:hypothetical protein
MRELQEKLQEIQDYASAGRKGNAAVSYDAIERLAKEAQLILSDQCTCENNGDYCVFCLAKVGARNK